ncbi:MAG: HEAT repeat domain-containing protein [Clostridiales Family XIII bacterium]|jgi:hypothetical protein|nr:HEAT repeat domain-containing protein [Clostridiales Family XIII bacterium]
METEIIRNLRSLAIAKAYSPEAAEYVGEALDYPSDKVKCKALWVLGEMGLRRPDVVAPYVPAVAALLSNKDSAVRERAVNALGRIGRSDFSLIEPYWQKLFDYAQDEAPNVRFMFIWASENIATTNPQLYGSRMDVFARLLNDTDPRVRIEAPEIFRVIGKRMPQFVFPYIGKLKHIATNDTGRVIRIHAAGAVNTTIKSQMSDRS